MTGHPGWLCLGGHELINQQRVFAYTQTNECGGFKPVACDSCGPEMAVALEDANGVYTTPAADPAPWYSTTEPYSGEFMGFYVLSIEGLAPGRITRSLTQRASGRGSFFGPIVRESPIIEVTGVLLGGTPCGVAYGYRWLNLALQGPACADGCTGDDLTFLDCCPTWTPDPVEDIEPHLRTMKNVQLVSGLEVTQRIGDTCGCHPDSADLVFVKFQLAASEPCVYREPVIAASNIPFDIANPSACVTWLPIGEGDVCPDDGAACADPVDCLIDPACPPPTAPPVPPAPQNPCICDPMATVKACVTIDSSAIPEWATGVPIITIFSGANALQQVRMTFIANPFNQDPDDLDPCGACGEVTLSRIPANSTFIMDGTTRTVTIQCPGSGLTDATPLLGSSGGSLPFRFPELECGNLSYVLCVTAEANTTATDASISASISVREC